MTRAFTACSYSPITKASSDIDRLARAVPGETLYEFIEKFIEAVSLMVVEDGEPNMEMVLLDIRGGLKISLASSSWLIPSSFAARWTAAGFLNLS